MPVSSGWATDTIIGKESRDKQRTGTIWPTEGIALTPRTITSKASDGESDAAGADGSDGGFGRFGRTRGFWGSDKPHPIGQMTITTSNDLRAVHNCGPGAVFCISRCKKRPGKQECAFSNNFRWATRGNVRIEAARSARGPAVFVGSIYMHRWRSRHHAQYIVNSLLSS